jgi:methyl-accepting chemotaxis protein
MQAQVWIPLTANEEKMNQNQHGSRSRIPWWRRQYIVNREMQKRYAWSAVIIGVVSSGLSAGMLLWSFWVFNIWQGQRLPGQVIFVIIALLFINVAGIYTAAVLSTSRIAGPLFNLLKQFSKMSGGDFSARASFRKNDEIHYVARRFNDMAERLEKRNIEHLRILDEMSQKTNDQNVLKDLEALKIQLSGVKKFKVSANPTSIESD